MFFGNTAAYRGGAIISTGCTPVVINNSIIRNRCTVSSSSATGGGILALSGAAVSGGNNIVWDNTSYTNPNIGGTVNFTYSNVQGGLTGTGNINSNPFHPITPDPNFKSTETFASIALLMSVSISVSSSSFSIFIPAAFGGGLTGILE